MIKENSYTLTHYLSLSGARDQIQDMIDDIMDNFDFEKVHKVMEALDWGWITTGYETEVPDTYTIKKAARQLLKSLIESARTSYSQEYYSGIGGFESSIIVLNYDTEEQSKPDYVDDAEHQIKLTLKFIVESWGDI